MRGTPEGREERLMPGAAGDWRMEENFSKLGKETDYESIGRGQLQFAGVSQKRFRVLLYLWKC